MNAEGFNAVERQHAVGGAPSRHGVFRRRDRTNSAASAQMLLNTLSKPKPGCAAAVREVKHLHGGFMNALLHQYRNGLSQIFSRRGRPALIIDNAQRLPFRQKPAHGVKEVSSAAPSRVEPGRADDHA